MTTSDRFKHVKLSGSARERGLQHGAALADEIAQAISFYESVFKLPRQEILALAHHFENIIGEFNQDYLLEIKAIAEGADVDPLWITALNARTEILSLSKGTSNECTAICIPEMTLLAQNWDWGEALEELVAVFCIEKDDGTLINTISEPGMLGKVGMNSHGLGVCLNILTLDQTQKGLPIHIMLRAILDCDSMDAAKTLVSANGKGKASNVMMADAIGQSLDVEFAGEQIFQFESAATAMLHTNHYLGALINSADDEQFHSSYARFNRASELLEQLGVDLDDGMEIAKQLLSDKQNTSLPILRKYIADELLGRSGTVCTVIMDLAKKEMHLRKGCQEHNPFHIYSLQ